MKSSKSVLAFVLFSALLAAATAQARPRPDKAADYADKQAAWQEHKALVAASPFAGLKWRSVGPVVQGGRLVDLEVVPGQPYTYLCCLCLGWVMENHQ
jgi:hypothetical protein